LEADDTLTMRRGLAVLGVAIDDLDDPWLVRGSGGKLTAPSAPVDAGEAGTVARFLTAVACLVPGPVTIEARGRMKVRPMEELVTALGQLGARVDHRQLPLVVRGGSIRGGRVTVDPSRSSQFVSALLLVAPLAGADLEVIMSKEPVSRPYLTSTVEVMEAFGARVEDRGGSFLVESGGYHPADYEIEADASAAAYPLVAAAITAGSVLVEGIPATSTQPDLALLSALAAMGCRVTRGPGSIVLEGPAQLRAVEVDMEDAPDASLALAVACVFAGAPSRIGGLGTLRHKESDRLVALEAELNRVGALARVEDDSLLVGPGRLRPALVDTHNDHRIAMSLALVGLRQAGIVIDRPSCVTKTWPNFFTVLARL
jgi:3-phosphoshikimate 1-carboxyvinyltransferase